MKKIWQFIKEKILSKDSKYRWPALAVLLCLVLAGGLFGYRHYKDSQIEEVKYTEFYKLAEEGKIDKIKYKADDSTFIYYLKDDKTTYKTDNPKTEEFKEKMLLLGIEDFDEKSKFNFSSIFSVVIDICILAAILLMLKSTGVLESEESMAEFTGLTFKDVAGLDELKEELKTIQYLAQNAESMKKFNVRQPRGILLEGPPGNGKTYLARAFAGESGMNYFSINASNIGNVFAGLGANQIESLFKRAKEKAPSVIFIDEIDSIGGRREGDSSSAGRDNTKTLTALLNAMDGFSKNDNVIVLAATNRACDLDPALVRPGRFDKQFYVPLPDRDVREQLVQLYLKDKNLADDVQMEWVIAETCGFSCASIESVINEAGLIAIGEDPENAVITKQILEDAMIKMEVKGHMKKEASKDQRTKKITAYHEAGHTVISWMLTDSEVSKVTILPTTSGAGGFTKSVPSENVLHTADDIRHQVMALYAGRQSELIMNGHCLEQVTVGCSNDIERATYMIKEYMNCMDFCTEESQKSRGLIDYRFFGSAGEEDVMVRVQQISAQLLKETDDYLSSHWDIVERVAQALLTKETLYKEDLEKLIQKGDL